MKITKDLTNRLTWRPGDLTEEGPALTAATTEGDTMPWHIQQGGGTCSDSQWAVIKDDDGSTAGCHDTEAEAQDQLAALNAAENDTGDTETAGGKPSKGTRRDRRLKKNRTGKAGADMTDLQAQLAALRERVHDPATLQAREASDTNRPWSGVLVVEGVRTGDGREFASEALSWGDLPIPLRWQKEGNHGGDHDVTVNVGNITHMWREGNRIMGAGFIDTGHEDGAEIARRLENDRPGGISIDADDITQADIEFVWPESPEDETSEDDMLMMLFGSPEAVIFHAGRIRAATLVDIPAFVEAKIGLITDDEYGDLAAAHQGAPSDESDPESLVASLFPLSAWAPPPAAWFQDPKLSVYTPITVSEPNADGWRRIYGHGGNWAECHLNSANVCVTMPYETSHDWFLTGEIETDDGETVPVGQLVMNTDHAPIPMSMKQAVAFYQNTGAAVADVTVGNDAHGIWVAGAIRPDVDPVNVHKLRASGKLSGDWRRVGGKLRLVGFLVVNSGAFPVPRARVASLGHIDDDSTRVEALISVGVPSGGTRPDDLEALVNRRALDMLAQRVNQ